MSNSSSDRLLTVVQLKEREKSNSKNNKTWNGMKRKKRHTHDGVSHQSVGGVVVTLKMMENHRTRKGGRHQHAPTDLDRRTVKPSKFTTFAHRRCEIWWWPFFRIPLFSLDKFFSGHLSDWLTDGRAGVDNRSRQCALWEGKKGQQRQYKYSKKKKEKKRKRGQYKNMIIRTIRVDCNSNSYAVRPGPVAAWLHFFPYVHLEGDWCPANTQQK